MSTAFVGVLFGKDIYYNVVGSEGEFNLTGESIICLLLESKNKFVSDIFQSQSYDWIDVIDDEGFIFGDFIGHDNENFCTFSDLMNMMYSDEIYAENFYVYDIKQDVLLVKTPQLPNPLAIDYTNESDILRFREIIN